MAGGIDWFRWHHGSVTDPKFQLVARKSKQALASVIAVWAFVLEQASASEDRGAFGTIDCEAIDCLLGLEDGATDAILAAMGERGLVDDGAVSAWEKRQPKRERTDNTSTERSRAHRDRQRQEQQDGDKQHHATPEIDDATPCNATQHQKKPRGEESREEEKKEEEKKPRIRAAATTSLDGVPENMLADFIAVRKAKRAGPLTDTAIAGLKREAAKAGLTLEQAVRACIEFGWQGFNAGWYADRSKTTLAKNAAIDPCPQWCAEAGFEHIAEAENARCHIGNYRDYKNGKRVAHGVAA